MAANFRRGMTAMKQAEEAANTRPQQGDRAPFIRQISWTKDQEKKFVIFLNPAEEIPTVELHEFIPTGTAVSRAGKTYTKYEQFISRTDPALGESSDDLTDRLGRKAKLRTVATAVELEPIEEKNGARTRVTGFKVKTETFERKNEAGEIEEVTAPVVGVVVQAPSNFFGWVSSFNESTDDIEKTPLQIIRRGKDANTAYDFTPYVDVPVDYSNLVQYAENIAYIREEALDLTGDEKEVALAIGKAILDKRLDELADSERYERLVSPITEIRDPWGGGSSSAPRRTVGAETRAAAKAAPAADPSFDSMIPPVTPRKGTAKFEELRAMHENA